MTAAATQPRHRPPATMLVGGGVLAVLGGITILHLGLGASGLGLSELGGVLTGSASPEESSVLLGSRLPRTLAGVVAGLALGVSGALIQGATRNPLGAPDTLGVNAGAYFAVALAAYLGFGSGMLLSGAAAFLGGLGAVSIVYLLTARGVMTPGRVLLAGATVALAGTSAAEFLQLLDENATRGIFFWGNGTLLQTSLQQPVVIGLAVGVITLLAPLLARPLDLISLGDESAESLGVRVGRIRPAAWFVAVLLSSAAVTLTGPIGFVGLVAPVTVRLLGIRNHAALLPLAGLFGAALVLGADSVAQLLFPTSAGFGEVPVGIVTALVGGPVFVLLARRATTGDADTGAAVSVTRVHGKSRHVLALGTGLVVLAIGMVVGLRIGDVAISWGQIAAVLTGAGESTAEAVVSFRLPRILVAAVAGACLAVAGTAVQSVVRNPLAEPGLVGVTAGASVGAVLTIIVVPDAPAAMLPVAAAVGGVLALALVIVLAQDRNGLDPTRVVLVGLGVAATGMAAVNIMVVSSQMSLASALTWLAGSTYARDFDNLQWLALPALAAVVLAVAARPVNMLALGDDLPRALGLSVHRARMGVLGLGAVLAAGTAAVIGTVGFVGLVAPHLARRLVGNNTGRLVPMAAVVGAALVVVADALGRFLLAPAEIPVGIVTAIVGAPYLVWLLRRTGTG